VNRVERCMTIEVWRSIIIDVRLNTRRPLLPGRSGWRYSLSRSTLPVISAVVTWVGLSGCEAGQTGGYPANASLQRLMGDAPLLEATEVSAAPILGRPAGLALTGGVLWVRDAAGDPGLHLIEPGSGELMQSVGTRGDGPGGFSSSPFGLLKDAKEAGVIWAWDPGLQRLTRFEPRPLEEYELETVRLEGSPIVQRVVRVDSGRVIGVAGSDEARLALFAPNGRRERTVSFPLPGPDDAPHRSRVNAANQAIVLCSWPGRGFVLAHTQFERIEYYDNNGEFVRLAHVPAPSEPIFEPNEAGVPTFRWRRSHYIGCAASDHRLYALYAGRDLSSDWALTSSGNAIHVFGWDGRLHGAYRLDMDVSSIEIDPDALLLYATSFVDSGIYRFALPAM